MAVSEIQVEAIGVVNKYLRQNSESEINVSSAMRLYVYEVLGIESDVAQSDNNLGEEFGIELIEDFEDDDDEFAAMMGEMSEGDAADSIGGKATKKQLLEVFDETWREIQALIDRNFMALFQEKALLNHWLLNKNETFWLYTGIMSVKYVRIQFAVAKVTDNYFMIYCRFQSKLVNEIQKILASNQEYNESAEKLVKISIEARFPRLVRIAAVFDTSFHGRRNSVKRAFGPNRHGQYLEPEQKQYKHFIRDIYEPSLALLPSPEKTKKAEKLFDELVGISSKIEAMKGKSKPKELAKLQKKLGKIYTSKYLKEERKWKEDAVLALERCQKIEFTRIKMMKEKDDNYKLRQIQLISHVENTAEHFKTNMPWKFDANSDIAHFIHRKMTNDDWKDIDPLEGLIDFTTGDFEFFYTVIEEFSDLVYKYIKSYSQKLADILKTYIDYQFDFHDTAENFKKSYGIAAETEEMSPFASFFYKGILQNHSHYDLYKKHKFYIGTRVDEFKEEIEEHRKKIEAAREPVADRLQSSHLLVYEKVYEKYLEVATSPEYKMKCTEFRLYSSAIKDYKKKIQKSDPDAVSKRDKLFKKIDNAEKKLKGLAKDLKEVIESRDKIVKMKSNICVKVMVNTMEPCLNALKYLNDSEITILGDVKKVWEGFTESGKFDPIAAVKWLADERISLVDSDITAVMFRSSSTLF